MDAKSKIESLLPGAWSKWIFCLSPVLSAALYIRFPDLPSSWLPTSDSEIFLIRLLVSGLVLLLGSVSLIALLMYHNKKLSDSSTVKINYLIDKCAHHMAEANVYKESAEKSRELTDRTIATSQKMIEDLKKQVEQITSNAPRGRTFPGPRIPEKNAKFQPEDRAPR